MGNRWGNSGNSVRLYFGGAPKSLQMVIAAMKLKDTPWKESYDQPREHIQKHQLLSAQPLLLPSSHIHTRLLKNHNFDYMDLCRQSNVSAFEYAI